MTSHSRKLTITSEITEFFINPSGEIILTVKFRYPNYREGHPKESVEEYINLSTLINRKK